MQTSLKGIQTDKASPVARGRLYSDSPLVSEDFKDIPVIDLSVFLQSQGETEELGEDVRLECQKVAECFHKFGILLIKDPRVNFEDNETYIDLMEDYFEQTGKAFYAGQDLSHDIKPEWHYQVGATPELIEKARDHGQKITALNFDVQNLPQSPIVPVLDQKWRFMWKIGERPEGAADDFPQVIPKQFPEWETKMNKWGNLMYQAIDTIAEMAAVGMGVPKDTFTKRMKGGAHLLAPTGSDLERNSVGAVFAGWHYDISFMTIHGRSRYSGLSVWTRDWQKRTVKIPEGCLLVQAGMSFENITGGYVLAGFHEVIYTELTRQAFEKRRAALQEQGIDKVQWRVSSTMFTHFRNDTDVGPMEELSHLYSADEAAKYRRMSAFELLMQELTATGMVM